MHPVLCPRCGADLSFFRPHQTRRYCGECGWNVAWVCEVEQKQNIPLLVALPVLVSILALFYGTRWPGVLVAFSLSSAFVVVAFFSLRKRRQRARDLAVSIGKKPGSDLSSLAPDSPPEQILARESDLRANPPRVSLHSPNPWIVWTARILLGLFVFVTARPLFAVEFRLEQFPGPWLYIGETGLALGLWALTLGFFNFKPLPARLLSAISLAKLVPAPDEMGTIFEYRDASGNFLRTRRHTNTGRLYHGTYIPVFYDKDNPAECIAACDLRYSS
jgi:hypothetical protein